MSNNIPKKWEQTEKALINKYKGTGKRIELITEDGAFVVKEGDNGGDYI